MASRQYGGRRKRGTLAEAKKDARQMAGDYAHVAIRTLVSICRNSESDSARVSAANSILDRAYGKPASSLDLPDNSMMLLTKNVPEDVAASIAEKLTD